MKARGLISLVTVTVFLFSTLLIGNVSAFTPEQEKSIIPIAKDFENGSFSGVKAKYTEQNSIDSTCAHDGKNSLKVSNRQYTWEGPQIDLMGKMKKGESYYCSTWVYQETGEPQTFRFTAYSCDDSSENQYDGKFYTTVAENLEVPSGVWTRLEGVYTYQYEGVAKALVLYVEASELGFDFNVDDLIIAGPSFVNTSFEDESTKGWTGNGASLSTSDEFAKTGDYSMKVTGRKNAWEGPVTDLMGKLQKGSTYYASAWVYQESGAPQTFRFTGYSMDDSSKDAYDGKFYKTIAENLEVPSGEWTRLEGLYTYDYTGVPGALTFYIESTDISFDFYVDDIVIAGQGMEVDNSVICDADFEGSFDGWVANGTGSDATLSINEATAHDGINSLLVTGRADTWQGAKFDLMNKVKKGQIIDISLWVYQATGKEQKMTLSLCADADGDPTYTTIASDAAVPSRNWAELKGTYTVSYTGELENLFLYVEAADKTMNIGIDDVMITTPVAEDGIETDIPSLKDVFKDYFPVGVAVPASSFDNELQSELIKKHFNSITAENDMKVDSMQPTEGNFNFAKGDAFVEFTQENGMRLRGHNLCWHQAVPSWLFVDDEGETVTRDVLLERMKTHIQSVIKNYGDKVAIWDVVNEAIGDTQPYGLRDSKWRQIIGDDYVLKAFEYAHEALVESGLEGKVKLYYNDYNNEEDAKKREAILKLVKELKEQGYIDGVGHQAHIGINYGSVEGIKETLKAYLDLGLEVELTELDMSVYNGTTAPDAPITEEQLIRQAYKYKDLAEMLKELDTEYPDKILGVTFWGLKDDMTWLNYLSDVARTDAPLLFDKYGKAKYAYWGMVDASKLPVFVNNAMTFKGSPVVGGEIDDVWNSVAKTIEIKDLNGKVRGTVKTLWDDKNLYAYVNADRDYSKVEFFVDENNSKNEVNEAEDIHYTVKRQYMVGSTTPTVTDSVYDRIPFEVAIPFKNDLTSDKLGFDVRLTLGVGQNAELVSWNDIKNNQDTDTSGYGVLRLMDPKYTEAKKGTPIVDGKIDSAWASANEITTDVVTAGKEPAKAKVKTMWDEKYLYVLAEVNDTTLSASSTNPWEQDSVEFFVDENNGRTSEYEADDAQYRVNYANVQSFGGNCVQDKFTTVSEAVYDKDVVSGYIVEAAIPFNTISGSLGHVMGFDLQINDDSNSDGVRDGMSNWSDSTGVGYKNTEAFGLLKLVEASKTYTVSGYIKSDFGYAKEQVADIESGFVVEIVGTGLKAESQNGYFEIDGVPENADGYTLKITKQSYLVREIKGVTVKADTEVSTEASPVVMWAGNIAINGVQDNAINMEDIMYVCKSFNTVKGDERYIAGSDLNKDGAINIEDIVIISKHFNKTSAAYNK